MTLPQATDLCFDVTVLLCSASGPPAKILRRGTDPQIKRSGFEPGVETKVSLNPCCTFRLAWLERTPPQTSVLQGHHPSAQPGLVVRQDTAPCWRCHDSLKLPSSVESCALSFSERGDASGRSKSREVDDG